jgi:hypothetical protein
MTKKITLSILCSFFLMCSFAQKKTSENKTEKKPIQHEFGLNVTSLLTDLLGNNNRTDAGNYLISYKRVSNNKALRIGLTTNFSLKKEQSFSFQTQLLNQNLQLRLGRETRQNISPKFIYYYGLDGIAGYKQEQSNATTATLNVLQTDLTLTIGGGPILGFQYALFDKLLIGTEGSLYAAYFQSSVKFNNFGSTAVFPSKNATGVNFQTNLPKFLFLIVKF